MSQVQLNALSIPAGYASAEVASFAAQMDDQLRRQHEATRTLTPEDLAWQPARGMNTIGMLMAHQAIVELWWTGLILEDRQPAEVDAKIQAILGIGGDDDGMPIAEDAAAPDGLSGKSVAFYDDLLARARAHFKSVAAGIRDDDLTRRLQRTRPNGQVRECEVRWTIYHIHEHFAGHFGQILLLQHARRALGAPVSR
ncbi:MAG: DinB family protein [Candidatus Eiseniibacteriota bacterium]